MVEERGKVLFEDNFDREDADDTDDLGPDWSTNSKSRAQGDKQNDLVGEVLATADKKVPIELKTGEWLNVVTLHQGDSVTFYIDGEEIGSHTPPGFAHETKKQFVFAVPKRAQVDDLKIWKLEPKDGE
jgi:hypothetical protein